MIIIVKLTAQQIADKWARKAGASQQDYVAGVQSVTESPMEKAVAAKTKWVAGIQKAAADGTWEAGLRKVSLTDWKNKTAKVGGARYVQGITEGKTAYQIAMAEQIPYMEQLQAQIDSMPSDTLEDNIARSNAWIRGMHAYGEARKGV